MLHATEILGAETFDSAGNFVGRVKEMFIEPADQPNRVARLLLGRGQYRPIVGALRPDRVGRARSCEPHHRRVRPRTLPPQ